MKEINKVALLIDAGFFLGQYKKVNAKNLNSTEQLTIFINETLQKIQDLTGSYSKDVIFRTYYYDCKPFAEARKRPDGINIDFKQLPVYQYASNFLEKLRTMPQLALRLGQISFDGWITNEDGSYKPIFKQKSVDMKIGLDIAWLSTKQIVDKIVLVTADSDFISPMKFARKEGLLVYLYPYGQKKVKIELREHADFIIE